MDDEDEHTASGAEPPPGEPSADISAESSPLAQSPPLAEPSSQSAEDTRRDFTLILGICVVGAALIAFATLALFTAERAAHARRIEAQTSLASATVYAASALEARLQSMIQRVRASDAAPAPSGAGSSLRRLEAAPDPLLESVRKGDGLNPAATAVSVVGRGSQTSTTLSFPALADAGAGPSIVAKLQRDWLGTALDSGKATDALAFFVIAPDGRIAGESGAPQILEALDFTGRVPIDLLGEASLSPEGIALRAGANGTRLIIATAPVAPGLTLAAAARLAPAVVAWTARITPFTLLGSVPLVLGFVLVALIWRQGRALAASENARRSSELVLNLAVTSTGTGLWDWDIPGGRIFWSGPLLALTGRPSRGTWLTLEETYQLLLPADVPKLERFREQIVQGITAVEGVLRLQSLQGRTIWCQARLRPWQDGNDRIVGMFLDMTAAVEARLEAEAHAQRLQDDLKALEADDGSSETRARLEQAIAESEKARLDLADVAQKYATEKTRVEEANRTKSEFLANMSHELKTPLNAIIGFSEIMHNELYGAMGDERYRGYASDIYASGRQLSSLIDDILEMSKIEAGKVELTIEDLDVTGLVGECVRLMEPRAREAGVAIDNLVADAPEAYGDRRATKRILMNLLTNAVKFTPRSGRITLQAQSDKRFVKISVADTGIGIAEDDLERIVKPFEQVEQHQSRSHRGTGLGLAISKALSEMQGGTLEIESTQGVGTKVSFDLPRDRVIEAGSEIQRAG